MSTSASSSSSSSSPASSGGTRYAPGCAGAQRRVREGRMLLRSTSERGSSHKPSLSSPSPSTSSSSSSSSLSSSPSSSSSTTILPFPLSATRALTSAAAFS
uniref:Uncharacterized protein n=1 Tax=Triticum urartu TaxID=4572 RepID=A0A8R7VG89_TRIUA